MLKELTNIFSPIYLLYFSDEKYIQPPPPSPPEKNVLLIDMLLCFYHISVLKISISYITISKHILSIY